MKIRYAFAALCVAATLPLCAQEAQKVATVIDGQPATITLQKFAGDDDAGFCQILVTSGDRTIWAGPKSKKYGDPLCFQYTPGGSVELEAAGDTDGDGATEVVFQEPQSDVRAPVFRVLKWGNHTFTLRHHGTLVETPAHSGHFPYRDGNIGEGLWVNRFKSVSHGQLTAEMGQYAGNGVVKNGTAILTADGSGYHLVRWTSPLKTRQ